MSDTPRMNAARNAAMEHMTGDVWRVGCDIERELNAANDRIKRLEREVKTLRLYGNKDCTAQADEVLKEQAKPIVAPAKPKPCPFCGASEFIGPRGFPSSVQMECGSCLAFGPLRSTHASATDAWNSRKTNE